MSHTWHQCKLRFKPNIPIFLSLTSFYFVTFFFEHPVPETYNKLKSLKVAQMHGCVDNGVCNTVCGMSCGDVVCDVLCDVVCDGVSGE